MEAACGKKQQHTKEVYRNKSMGNVEIKQTQEPM